MQVYKWVAEAWNTGVWDNRRGALLAAAHIAEGCSVQVTKDFKDWLTIVVEGLKNQEVSSPFRLAFVVVSPCRTATFVALAEC